MVRCVDKVKVVIIEDKKRVSNAERNARQYLEYLIFLVSKRNRAVVSLLQPVKHIMTVISSLMLFPAGARCSIFPVPGKQGKLLAILDIAGALFGSIPERFISTAPISLPFSI